MLCVVHCAFALSLLKNRADEPGVSSEEHHVLTVLTATALEAVLRAQDNTGQSDKADEIAAFLEQVQPGIGTAPADIESHELTGWAVATLGQCERLRQRAPTADVQRRSKVAEQHKACSLALFAMTHLPTETFCQELHTPLLVCILRVLGQMLARDGCVASTASDLAIAC